MFAKLRNREQVLLLELALLEGRIEAHGNKTEEPISVHLSLRLGQQLAFLEA